MNSETGEIKLMKDLSEMEKESGLWTSIGELKEEEEEKANLKSHYVNGKKKRYVDLREKSRLANKARNLRKKKKKMTQKAKVKNRGV